MRRNVIRWGVALLLAVSLGGCGYHLAGQGGDQGAIPAGTETVVVRASGLDANRLAQELMALMRVGADYTLQRADEPHATDAHSVELRIEDVSVHFVPAAYGRTGIATQYRLTLIASLSLYQGQTLLWKSGPMAAVAGDVYVTSGPASVEASRERVEQAMRRQWARQAWERLQSGF